MEEAIKGWLIGVFIKAVNDQVTPEVLQAFKLSILAHAKAVADLRKADSDYPFDAEAVKLLAQILGMPNP